MSKIKHIVLIEFKPEVSTEQIEDFFSLIKELENHIPGLLDYCGGSYFSPEGFNRGFTHGFIMTFKDSSARDEYLVHPEHKAAAETMIPLLQNSVAFDFQA